MKSFAAGLLLVSLVLFSTLEMGSCKNGKLPSKSFFSKKWNKAGLVPNKLAEIPPNPLYMRYKRKIVTPSATISTGRMLDRPTLRWKAEKGAMYTVFIIDFGIERLEGLQYVHWLTSNVKSNG